MYSSYACHQQTSDRAVVGLSSKLNLRLITAGIHLIYFASITCPAATETQSQSPTNCVFSEKTVSVSCVARSSVELPCNLTSPKPGDQVRLVLWFKNDSAKPIYTYDTRGGNQFRINLKLSSILFSRPDREKLSECPPLV